MGLVAAGVNGLKLADKDEVVGMEILPAEGEIFLITSEGKAKRVEQKEFPVQGRYGRGVIAWDIPEKIRLAGAVVVVVAGVAEEATKALEPMPFTLGLRLGRG